MSALSSEPRLATTAGCYSYRRPDMFSPRSPSVSAICSCQTYKDSECSFGKNSFSRATLSTFLCDKSIDVSSSQ